MILSLFSCENDMKFWVFGDCEKCACDAHRIDKDKCLVYSDGSCGNFSFENDILCMVFQTSSKCEIHTFDPPVTLISLNKRHSTLSSYKPCWQCYEELTKNGKNASSKPSLNWSRVENSWYYEDWSLWGLWMGAIPWLVRWLERDEFDGTHFTLVEVHS